MRITGTITSSFSDVVIEGVMVRIRVNATPEQVDAMPATVDIYPHAEFLPANMECTPENFAHCLARLAHAEDNLAREVRSSQALATQVRDLEVALTATRSDLQTCVKVRDDLAAEVAILRAAAAERAASDAEHQRRTELEADHRSGASVQAILGKQKEQGRQLAIYRTKYHDTEQTLNVTRSRLAEVQASLAQHPALPPGATEELVTALAGCCSWSLSVNDYRSGYESVRDYLTSCGDNDEELLAACEASGALYELQVYERTPVAFVVVKAPSFTDLLEQVRGHAWETMSPVMSR